jgi:hypothetical protein
MPNKALFDSKWLSAAKASRATLPSDSWLHALIENYDRSGKTYLTTLRGWFDAYPLSEKPKKDLLARLESGDNAQHLGAVNELSWWRFIVQEKMTIQPVPVSKTSRPDFHIVQPNEFFSEVSTVNQSAADRAAYGVGDGVELDQDENCRRILGVLTDAKKAQLQYAANQKRPGVLVIFDYQTWSGFGTEVHIALRDCLNGSRFGFATLPTELSAIVYLERGVNDVGRIQLSRSQSAVYRNPYASYPLPNNILTGFQSPGSIWLRPIVESRCWRLRRWIASLRTQFA